MAPLHQANILLVDDSPANLKALVAILEPLGYNLVTALSGKNALKHLLHQEFAIVLLDVQMPEMDGFETAQLIHSRPATQYIPIIFLTAIYSDLSYACQGYSAGAVDYLLKPLVPEILLSKVKIFVELYQKNAIVQEQAKQLTATNTKLKAEIRERQIAIEKLQQAQIKLYKSETALITAQRIAHLGNWELDVVNKKFTWSNELFCIFGFDYDLEPTYTDYFKYIHPDDRSVLQNQFERAIAEKIPFNIEYRILQSNHSIRYLESKAEIVVNNQGKTIKLLGTTLDITERQETELEITKNRDLREAIFNESADALFVVSPVTLLPIDCNDRAVELFQAANKSELIGIDYHTLLQKPLSVDELAAVNKIHQQKIWSQEIEFITRQNNNFWGNIAVKEIKIANQVMHLVRITDISDRKRMEDALRQSEEKFRQLAENIQAVFWMSDIESQQILYVSNAYETIWQRSCQSLYQNYSDWLDAIHPEDRQYVEFELVQQIKTGKYDKKYRIIRPDDSIRWIRDRAFPIKNEVGEIVRIGGIAEDITEQQQIEQIKSEFISIVSHELRTPLTAIRAALGLLQTGIYDQKPDKFKRMIEIAAIDSDRLVRLVNDILDLERLESNRNVLQKTTCNAADLIEQAVAGVEAIAKPQNITFNINPTNAKVWAADDAIIQTLINLLVNAIKFSPANSIIIVSVQEQKDDVLFQITDQGRGIPADKLEVIFGRFQQVDASDSRTKGGTGLGLAICRSIIDRHGGQIWVQSTVSVGSTFFFTLPIPEKC